MADTVKPKAKNVQRAAWKREASDQNITSKLGQRIRDRRERLGMSLSTASELSSIPAATLSRIETNKMSPTFPVLLKLMTGLRLPWSDLMGSDEGDLENDFTIAHSDDFEPTMVPGYAYWAPHHSNPLSEHIQPLIFEVLARDLESAGGLRGHKGYEFCYILDGGLTFHVEGENPRKLRKGASMLFRCDIPHAYVSTSVKPARILNITIVDPVMAPNSTPFNERYPIKSRAAVDEE